MANYVEFTLWAPYNEQASLILILNCLDQPVTMEKGPDGRFRTKVKLDDGCYSYRFKVQSKSFFLNPDDWVEMIDPYATQIDQYAQNAIALVKNGQRVIDSYSWQHDQVELPDRRTLIIYETLVQDFAKGEGCGTFDSVIDQLDYLQSLGVNALELMPVQACPGDIGWGYSISHYFALRTAYGEPADFKRLVDECHRRHMWVILDIVLNHSDAESPLTQIDYDYWYRREPKDPDNSWGPEFDYDHYDDNFDCYPARQYMRDMVNFWVSEYHIDGLRFDAVKQLNHPDVLDWITDQAGLAAKPGPLYSIAEYIPEGPEIGGFSGPVDSSWRVSCHYNLLDLLLKENPSLDLVKQIIDPSRDGFQSTLDVINYTTSHDQNHLMADLADAGIFEKAAFKRAKLAAALVMTAVGIPMIWMGEEFGEYKSKTLEPAPLDWSLLDNQPNAQLLDYYRGLIQLRKTNPALSSDHLTICHENNGDRVLGYIRWHDMGPQVVILVNCSDHFIANYEVTGLPEDGSWHEWTKDYDVQVEAGRLVIDLPEYEAQILVWSS